MMHFRDGHIFLLISVSVPSQNLYHCICSNTRHAFLISVQTAFTVTETQSMSAFTTRSSQPHGTVRPTDVGSNTVTNGELTAAARCPGPESGPTPTFAAFNREMSSGNVVVPTRSYKSGEFTILINFVDSACWV